MRKIVVEPVIGNIKENLGLREFSLRGLKKVRIELNLVSIAHNLKKVWLARRVIYDSDKKLSFFVIYIEDYLVITGQSLKEWSSSLSTRELLRSCNSLWPQMP